MNILIQSTTGFRLKPITKIDKSRILCEYVDDNSLYQKGKKAIFYLCDLRCADLFDYLESKGE